MITVSPRRDYGIGTPVKLYLSDSSPDTPLAATITSIGGDPDDTVSLAAYCTGRRAWVEYCGVPYNSNDGDGPFWRFPAASDSDEGED